MSERDLKDLIDTVTGDIDPALMNRKTKRAARLERKRKDKRSD